MLKICTKCKEEKTLEQFHNHKRVKGGKVARCKLCNQSKPKTKERSRIDVANYKLRHPEKVKETFKNWYEKNKHITRVRSETTKAKGKIWVAENKERLNELRKLRKKNPTVNQILEKKIRDRFYKVIVRMKSGKKFTSCMNLVGCDMESLKVHIESQFKDGMSWNNHGNGYNKWNIDHIKPLVTFDLNIFDEQLLAFHYTNLRPLWFDENMKRSRKNWIL